MYYSFLVGELKKWVRQPMLKFLLGYPLFFAVIGRYGLPALAETAGFDLIGIADFVVVAFTLMIPQIFGALLGFSLLDDRDDQVLTSIQVTPLSLIQFLSFRFVMIFALAFLATLFVMWFIDIGDLPLGAMIAISFLAALMAPMLGMLINAFSSNKIEGFAVMKGLGTLLLFPILGLFFFDATELIFGIVPGFWPAKAISSVIRGEEILYLTYGQYLSIGLVYTLLWNVFSYRFFSRKLRF